MNRLLAVFVLCLPALCCAQGKTDAYGVEAECIQQLKGAGQACGQQMMVEMKACFQRRLSPACAQQANAPSNVPRDAACQAEFKTVAEPCAMEGNKGAGRCMQSKSSPKCFAQMMAANDKRQATMKRCQEMMPRVNAEAQRCAGIAVPKERDACMEAAKAQMAECRNL